MQRRLLLLTVFSSLLLQPTASAEGPRRGESTFPARMEWLYDGMRGDFRPELEAKLGKLFGGRSTTSVPVVRDYGVLANLFRKIQAEYGGHLSAEESRRLEVLRMEFDAHARRHGWFDRFGEDQLVEGMDARFASLERTPNLRLLERRAEAWEGTNVGREIETRIEREIANEASSEGAAGAGVRRE